MDDKKLGEPKELTDAELGTITGGATLHIKGDKYFRYVGSNSDSDWSASYLCPKCGNPVHYTSWGFFKCDTCDEKWYWEYKLVVNEDSGVWQEISREEFMKRLRPEYRRL